MSFEKDKYRARNIILMILAFSECNECHNRQLTGRLQSMGFSRKVYDRALTSLRDSGQIEQVSAGDSPFWRLAEQPAAVS